MILLLLKQTLVLLKQTLILLQSNTLQLGGCPTITDSNKLTVIFVKLELFSF